MWFMCVVQTYSIIIWNWSTRDFNEITITNITIVGDISLTEDVVDLYKSKKKRNVKTEHPHQTFSTYIPHEPIDPLPNAATNSAIVSLEWYLCPPDRLPQMQI